MSSLVADWELRRPSGAPSTALRAAPEAPHADSSVPFPAAMAAMISMTCLMPAR